MRPTAIANTGVPMNGLDRIVPRFPMLLHFLPFYEVILPRGVICGMRRALFAPAGPFRAVETAPQFVVICNVLVVLSMQCHQ